MSSNRPLKFSIQSTKEDTSITIGAVPNRFVDLTEITYRWKKTKHKTWKLQPLQNNKDRRISAQVLGTTQRGPEKISKLIDRPMFYSVIPEITKNYKREINEYNYSNIETQLKPSSC